jgi:lipoyl(octanoyl) transferase
MDGPDNMALDEALLRRAHRTGECVLRVYSWTRPTLSFGRNQRVRGAYDLERARELGIGVVRRNTGGRALLHHREVTYSVTGPVDGDSSLKNSYNQINAILLQALRALGVAAELAPAAGRMPPPGSAPCFELPAPGEVTCGGRKLVGSAQLREGHAFLQHGSILIDDDQALVSSLTMGPVPSPARAATLREALGRAPSVREVSEVLFAAVAGPDGALEGHWAIDEETAADCASTRVRYESDEWTLSR